MTLIIVSEEVHKELWRRRIDKGLKSHDHTIWELLENENRTTTQNQSS